MKSTALIFAGAALLATGACTKVSTSSTTETSAISEADAAAAVDAAQAAWVSMDAAKIEAVYAKDIVAFDPGEAKLSTDWDNWHRLQVAFAGMKLDRLTVTDRKIQILDDEDFIVSGTGNFTSKDGPMKAVAMRFTDVFRKQADGKFLIVNEHTSFVPTAPVG